MGLLLDLFDFFIMLRLSFVGFLLRMQMKAVRIILRDQNKRTRDTDAMIENGWKFVESDAGIWTTRSHGKLVEIGMILQITMIN